MTDLPTSDTPFQLLLRVRYGECDAQQVVYNARYADYIDIAATEYFRALFGSYQQLLDQGIDNQVVRLLINWKSSARFDDVLAIRVSTTHIGNTSFSLQMVMSDWQTGRLITLTEATYVAVDAKTLSKIAVSDDYRARLERGAANVLVNQAGVVLPQTTQA
jgi:acyl-CoA thioester hydrolase